MLITSKNYLLAQNFLEKCVKISSISSKTFSTQDKQPRKIPKCVYVLPPTQWLKNKINFQRLKNYDNEFNEKEFKVGASQAALVLMELARERNSPQLAKISTIRGFSRIYRDMIASQNDPRRKLLYFNLEDIQKVVPTDVHIVEHEKNVLCLIEVFFVCLKYLDDVMNYYKHSNPNVSLQIYQDIKDTEKMLKKKNYSEKSQIPLSEKLLVAEGYLHLFTNYGSSKKEASEWKIDYFKISEFNIVHHK